MESVDEATKRYVWKAVRAGWLYRIANPVSPFKCESCCRLGEAPMCAGCVRIPGEHADTYAWVCAGCVDVLTNACAPASSEAEAEKPSQSRKLMEDALKALRGGAKITAPQAEPAPPAAAEKPPEPPKLPFEQRKIDSMMALIKRCASDGYITIIPYTNEASPIWFASWTGVDCTGTHRPVLTGLRRYLDAHLDRTSAPEQPPTAEPAPAAAQSAERTWSGFLRSPNVWSAPPEPACDSPDAPHNPELWDAILLAEELRVEHNGIGGVYLYLGHDGDNVCELKDFSAKEVGKGHCGRSLLEAVQPAVTDRAERRASKAQARKVKDEIASGLWAGILKDKCQSGPVDGYSVQPKSDKCASAPAPQPAEPADVNRVLAEAEKAARAVPQGPLTFAVGDQVVRADGVGGIRLMRVVAVSGEQVTCAWEETIVSIGAPTVARAHMAMTVPASALKKRTAPAGNPAGDARG